MRRSKRLLWLISAICAVALLLSACGGSGDGTQSFPSTADTPGSSTAPEGHATKATGGSGPKQPAKATRKASEQDGTSSNGSGSGSGTQTAATPAQTPKTADPARGQKGAPKQVHIKGCPTGLNKVECAAIGRAYEQQKSEPASVVAADECPAAMSKGECEAAGKALEEAQAGSHVVAANECPRAMTEAQCIEAGKAYEEATK
jgi:hypothetical protein